MTITYPLLVNALIAGLLMGGFYAALSVGATIAFGQAMPQDAMRRARNATLGCELFVAIGSSLVVHPAAAFPMLAKENGASLVIVNRDPTPLDAVADLVLRQDIGEVFEPMVAGLPT